MRLVTAGCLVLAIVLAAVCLTAAAGTQGTWSTVADQQAPQVVDATGLYQALTDMDAQTANVMMFGSDAQLSGNRATALTQYAQDRTVADRDLQRATVDAAGSTSVQQALVAVLDGMGSYQDLAGRALELNEHVRATAGQPDSGALAEYRQATDLMRLTLLPAADRLVQANNDAFNQTYASERSALGTAELWTLVLGAGLLVALLGLQVWLARRFRRIVNPPLAAATLLVLLFVGLAGSLFPDQGDHLRHARRDAFDSVVALSRARAVAYDANADESRYLLDHARAPQYQDAFEAKSQQIVALPGATLAGYDAALVSAITAYRADHSDVRFGGFYGTEFRNITFTGERAAAEQALLQYQVYERDDRAIRALVDVGHLRQAIAYCTNYAPGGSNAAFTAHDAALQKLIGINTDAFGSAVRDGQRELEARIPVLAGSLVLVALLTLLGVRPRLAEFRR
ncbi:hypothetical protein [Streptacidiphilus sp. EB103A]|uniref:hypothetical protein n=1 Tax=Streptacidiphilus sp. EB103A TaxID=3156275 RepID=UPI003516C4F9